MMENSDTLMILTAFGSLILLLSWILQNYYVKKWEGQISDSKERMDIITNYANRHDLYSFEMYLFQSIALQNNDPKSTKNFVHSLQQYLINFVEMQTQIQYHLALDKEKYSENYSTKAEEKEAARITEITQKAENSDISGLIDLAGVYAKEVGGNFDSATNEITAFLGEMSKTKKFYNKIYLGTYILGTFLLALVATIKYVIPAINH